MRKVNFGVLFFLAILLVSSVSAQVVFNSQPSALYNLGGVIKVPIQVTSPTDNFPRLVVTLVCDGTNVNTFYNGTIAGSNISISIPLRPDWGVVNSGNCRIKAILGTEGAVFTNNFRVSNKVSINVSSTGKEFKPGQQILIQGNAVKENGENLDGKALVNITSGNSSVYHGTAEVKKGFFYFNFSLPDNSKAGTYSVGIYAYETDSSGVKTNYGSSKMNLLLVQVPTSLEIMVANKSVVPGQTAEVKAILHDQTGERINSTVNFTVYDGRNDIMDQKTIDTGKVLRVPISYDSSPSSWTVHADSGGLSSQSQFNILRKEKVAVDVINTTLIVTNKGNVPYNNDFMVKIGDNRSLAFNVSLEVGESKKYSLTAPNGNYSVRVLSDGANLFSGNLFLTGNAVSVSSPQGIINLVRYPLVWIFVFLILAFVVFLLFRRIRKKKFFGKANLNNVKQRSMKQEGKAAPKKDDNVSAGANKADMSLSIQGDKQDASVACLNIKNLEEIKSGKGDVKEVFDSFQQLAESSKSAIYENGNYFFFIFAPVKTKTFSNEKSAVQVAQQIKKILDNHNRLFKQKIVFGLAVNRGTIIAKQFEGSIKFMSLGTFSSVAKKLSAVSKGDILLGKEIRERLMSDVKTDKGSEGGTEFYVLNELKDKSKSEKFIKDFMNKMEKENREKHDK